MAIGADKKMPVILSVEGMDYVRGVLGNMASTCLPFGENQELIKEIGLQIALHFEGVKKTIDSQIEKEARSRLFAYFLVKDGISYSELLRREAVPSSVIVEHHFIKETIDEHADKITK